MLFLVFLCVSACDVTAAFTCLSSSFFPCLIRHIQPYELFCLLLRRRPHFFLDFLCDFRRSSVSLIHLARIRLSRFFLQLVISPFDYLGGSEFVSTAIIHVTPAGSPVSCLLFLFRCSCPLHSWDYSLILCSSAVCYRFFWGFLPSFSGLLSDHPEFFIISRWSSDITHCRLGSVLGSVTSCVPVMLFLVKCLSRCSFS